MGYGASADIGLARETGGWGTPAAVASGDFFYALSENVTLAIDRFETRNLVGTRSEPDDTAGLRRVGGEVIAMSHPVYLMHALKGLTNSGSVAVVLSGFLHRFSYFTPVTDASTLAPFPSYTFEIFRDVTSSDRYAGAQFGRGVFAVQPNQELRLTSTIVAKTTSTIAKTAPTFPGSPQDPFTWDSASLQIGGAAVANIEAFTFTIDNQVEAIPALNNSVEAAFMRMRGAQLVNIGGTIGFDNRTEYNNFVTQTEQAFKLAFFKAQSFQLTFDWPRVVYTAFPLATPGRERLTVAFEGKVRYSTASATAFQIDLTTTPKSSF